VVEIPDMIWICGVLSFRINGGPQQPFMCP
jgi:hypothetical protein